jgi:hypothetical protein
VGAGFVVFVMHRMAEWFRCVGCGHSQ